MPLATLLPSLTRVDISGPPLNTKKVRGPQATVIVTFMAKLLSEHKETAVDVDFARQTTIQTVFHLPRRIVSEEYLRLNSQQCEKYKMTSDVNTSKI